MANLNIPFLVMTQNHLHLDVDEQCYFKMIEIPAQHSAHTDPVPATQHFIYSDKKGNIYVYDYHQKQKLHLQDKSDVSTLKILRHQIHCEPRLLLAPSFREFEIAGRLKSVKLIKSIAPKIIISSEYLYLTLHEDNMIRLWNTDDGRCLLQSQPDLFISKVELLRPIPNSPGLCLCIGEQGDIYVVNVFMMMILKHLYFGFKHHAASFFLKDGAIFSLMDKAGDVFEWAIVKDLKFHSQEQFKIQMLQQDENEGFHMERLKTVEYPQDEKILGIDVSKMDILSYFQYDDQGNHYVVVKDTGVYILSQTLESENYNNEKNFYRSKINAVFKASVQKQKYQQDFSASECEPKLKDAKFIPEKKVLLTVDQTGFLRVFRLEQLNEYLERIEELKKERRQEMEFEDYEYVYNKLADFRLVPVFTHQLVSVDSKFQYFNQTFYTVNKNNLAQYALNAILQSNLTSHSIRESKCTLEIMGDSRQIKEIKDYPLNYNDIVMQNFFQQSQFNILDQGEKITMSIVYISSHQEAIPISPSLISGTNHGKIIITPMCQLSEGKLSPLLVMSENFGEEITQLFLIKQRYVVAISQDSSISVIDMQSRQIPQQIQSFFNDRAHTNSLKKRRFDFKIKQATKNKKQGRRHSIESFDSQAHQNLQYYQQISPHYCVPFISPLGIQKVMEVKNIDDIRSTSSGKQSVSRPLHYLCIQSSDQSLFIVDVVGKLQYHLIGSDQPIIGIYYDPYQQYYYAISDSMTLFYFKKSTCTLERKGGIDEIFVMMGFDEAVQELWKQRSDILKHSHINPFDFDSFEKITKGQNLRMGLGNHKPFDFLNLSFNMRVKYSRYSLFSATKRTHYSLGLHDLIMAKLDFKSLETPSQKEQAIRTFNKIIYYNNDLLQSDASEEDLASVGVTSMRTHLGTSGKSSQSSQIMMVNVKRVIDLMRVRSGLQPTKTTLSQQNYNVLEQSDSPIHKKTYVIRQNGVTINPIPSSAANGFEVIKDKEEIKESFAVELERNKSLPTKSQLGVPSQTGFSAGVAKQVSTHSQPPQQHPSYSGQTYTTNHMASYPFNLLSLLHPFGVSDEIDESFDHYFKLSMPFVDMRLGVQGCGTAFSFILSGSREKSGQSYESVQQQNKIAYQNDMMSFKFFNDAIWEHSSYINTQTSTFILSSLVAIIESNELKISQMVRDWLNTLFTIIDYNKHRKLSIASISKLLLLENYNINSTARDILLKPILYNVPIHDLKEVINEWSELLMDTYNCLKNEKEMQEEFGENNSIKRVQISNAQSNPAKAQRKTDIVGKYFGELEIRGLILISYFSLFYVNEIPQDISRRCSKLIIILTREIVGKFEDNPKYIHLLTILLQLLSTGMKIYHQNYNQTQILEDIIKLLLYIFNSYKPPINQENLIVVSFLLYKNLENHAGQLSFDKAQSSLIVFKINRGQVSFNFITFRALLEIGENCTGDFLTLIQDQALDEDPEYQSNVLEILKLFIRGHAESLETHLIHLTQILLKCLDPNDINLRKNSHKAVSQIFSIMVKKFPMVSFHQDSQRLAVGTHNGPIAIYDVRTSAKWRVLEGHQGNVTAINFNKSGNYLVSYSSSDCSVRLWKVGNTGFFSSIMGSTGKSSKEIHLKRIQQKRKAEVTFSKADAMASILQANEERTNQCSINFELPKEKTVRLVREDRSEEILKMK